MQATMKIATFIAVGTVLLGTADTQAQTLALRLDGGRVTLEAHLVSVGEILGEWARIGGATIVNGDKVGGGPVTLHLVDVPEREALETVLREVSGYILTERRPDSVGASSFGRILILPVSLGPANPPPRLALAPRASTTAEAATPAEPPVDPHLPGEQPGIVAHQAPGAIEGGPSPATSAVLQPAAANPVATPFVVPVRAGNPFGMPTGSGQPGAVTPVAAPEQPAPYVPHFLQHPETQAN
jgi:hypothetical protein